MKPRWMFLTNHAHVLSCIARDHDIRLRDIAAKVGITERAAYKIVDELVEDGYLTRTRLGRRNRYKIHPQLQLRHPLHPDHDVGELLDLLEPGWREKVGEATAFTPDSTEPPARAAAAEQAPAASRPAGFMTRAGRAPIPGP